jgi:hypothetical protein
MYGIIGKFNYEKVESGLKIVPVNRSAGCGRIRIEVQSILIAMTKIEMYKIRFKICAAVVFCLLQTQTFVLAASPRNLALHRKLDYVPKPEYPLTVHPRDSFKLTDGIKDESLWYEKYREKTVGWWPVGLIEITIYLGQIYNVGFINVYTVGGGRAGVEYPEYAVAASSINGNQYAFSSFASSDGWDFGANLAKPQVINLAVEQPARYIKLFIMPTGYGFFTDEIEVVESQRPESDSLSGDYLSKDQMIDLVERARQLERDRDVLSEKVQKSAQSSDKPTGDWQAMKEKISQLSRSLTEKKVSKTEAEFAQFRAKWLKSEYKTEWLCYPAEPMDILRYGDLPQSVPDDFQISLYQWKNEYGAAAINLANGSTAPINFSVHFSPLRLKDKTIESAGIFELRRTLYVRVLNAGLVADPLVLQNAKPFPVAPGQMVQLWVEAYSKGLDAGAYTAALTIDASGENIAKTRQTIPIQLDIADKTFPETVPFYSCNWDYVTISDRFTSKNPERVKQAVSDLENHYINVVVIRLDKVFDDNKSSLSLQKLRNELTLRSKANPLVLLALGGQSSLERRFGTLRTIRWEYSFKIFLARFRDFMLNNGFDYDSFALYPFDEYVGDDFIYVARMIRDFDPQLKIYANKWIESESQFRKVRDLIDIWCPHMGDILANKDRFDQYQSSGVFDKIWCYHCSMQKKRFFAPVKTRESKQWRGGTNVFFWRTMPITAASLGMTGAGFWVYQDVDWAGWTKDKMGEYCVVYDGSQNPDKNCIPEVIVPSKRWQQWRQGIEDAVCLMGHKELLDEFLQVPNSKLTSEYLTSLRRRADEKKDNPK